jgi:hypothetical protein
MYLNTFNADTMPFPIPPITPSTLNDLINTIIDTGSIVHGGFIRDLVSGLLDDSWKRDIDVVASGKLLAVLKEKNIDIVPKHDGMLYGATDMATAEFMGYTLDLMIITDDFYSIKNFTWSDGRWKELFRTEDFQCNTLYIDASRELKPRSSYDDITTIVSQINDKQAFPTRTRPFTTLATIRRYLHRCYKMIKKGYALMDSKVTLVVESDDHWQIMVYNGNTYDYDELEDLF